MKQLLLFTALILLCGKSSAQDDSTYIPRPNWFLDCGPALSIGPEYYFLYPQQYGINFTGRYWIRNGRNRKVHDNTIFLGAGFFRIKNENLARFRLGDQLLLFKRHPPGYFEPRIGFIEDLMIGPETRVFLFSLMLEFKFPRVAWFAEFGVRERIYKAKSPFRSNFSIGFDYIFMHAYTYVN